MANGRWLKYLTIVDGHTTECLDILVIHSIPGEQIAKTPNTVAAFSGTLKSIQIIRGMEFTSKAWDPWFYKEVEFKLT